MSQNSTWTALGTSGANAGQTVSKAADTSQRQIIHGFTVELKDAAAGAEVTIEVRDGATAIYKSAIPSGAAVGEIRGVTFQHGLQCSAGAAANLVVGAAGAGAKTIANLWGRTE